MKPLELSLLIDLEGITKAVENSKNLNDNELVFANLSKIAFDRKQLDALNDAFEEVERMVKQAISSKAKALYGDDWQVIKGDGYKIGRSFTGSVYELIDPDKVDPAYLKVKFTPDTKAIEIYRETNDKLPDGVTINEQRNESIRIAVNVDNR
mgnify:CR=1 FL=1